MLPPSQKKKINKRMKIYSTLGAALLISVAGFAQTSVKEEVPKNWHQLDKATTGYYGISLDKAYGLLKTKKIKSKQVLVAVIDSGIDTLHEDLKPVLWTNPREIPYNGIDDDKNGYIDDVHGWNFIGGKDGRNVKEDSYEGARVYHKLKAKYGSLIPDETTLTAEEKAEVEVYKKAQAKVVGDVSPAEVAFLKRMLPSFLKGDSVIRKELGKAEYSCNDLQNYNSENADAKKTKSFLQQLCKANGTEDITNTQIQDEFEGRLRKAESADAAPKEYRKEIVQDNEDDINDRYYGNNDIMASTPTHGTHCSGIIAGVRNNGKGGDGVADNVRIMMLRAVPDGDEHDKDIANAIRYAVDNGAQVVSMSFGKDFSPQKHWVDDAVKYAETKGVLLVHAAGNDAKNVDTADNFPNANYINNKGRATNWITVGASGDPKNGGITASFSNYGKKEVDVFAPGVQIYATIPGGNTYGKLSGTSMACPVVAGTAALLLEYFPNLSAKQLKYVIEKSATAPDTEVNIPGTSDKVKLAELSKTGGLLNAYEAVKLASTLKGERIVQKTVLPKSTLNKPKKG
jgi:subtilisin family serine protease